MLVSPCFDIVTRTDCPLRAVGCRSTCAKWKIHEMKQREEYQRRQREFIKRDIEIGYSRESLRRNERRSNRK